MDLILLISVAISLLLILLTLLYFKKKDEKQINATAAPQRGIQIRPQENIPRRAQIARNQRLRTRNAIGNAGEPRVVGGTSSTSIPVHQQPVQQQQHSDNDDNVGTERSIPDFGDEKIGTKKRAKLEAKAEKKAQREQELKIREDRKKQEILNEEERRKQEEKEKEEEKKLEETERLAREEKEQRELEEYLKMKEAFSVEEEGYEDDDDDEKVNLLQEFINYIKDNKIVVLEDLASNFKLKTQAAIDRIHDLQKEGHLTGVIDDRGKFIYISEDELNSVAKFIRQRGRISITELAESSNNLINLMPVSG